MPNAAQLRWCCRRGTKELDLILLRFLEEAYPQLSEEEQDAFAGLLEEQDPDLVAWIWGGAPLPDKWRAVISKIRACSAIDPQGCRKYR